MLCRVKTEENVAAVIASVDDDHELSIIVIFVIFIILIFIIFINYVIFIIFIILGLYTNSK